MRIIRSNRELSTLSKYYDIVDIMGYGSGEVTDIDIEAVEYQLEDQGYTYQSMAYPKAQYAEILADYGYDEIVIASPIKKRLSRDDIINGDNLDSKLFRVIAGEIDEITLREIEDIVNY